MARSGQFSVALKDAAGRLDLSMRAIRRLARAKLVARAEFDAGNRFRPASVSRPGFAKLKLACELPEVSPDVQSAFVIEEAPNPAWARGRIDGREGKHLIFMPRKLRGKCIGKRIPVLAIKDGQGGVTWTHAERENI